MGLRFPNAQMQMELELLKNFHAFEETTIWYFAWKGRKAEVIHYKCCSQVFKY